MILDDRDGLGFSVNVELLMSPMKSIGTIGGIPASMYYQVPGLTKKRTTKYLMTAGEIESYYAIVEGNMSVYSGTVINGLNVSGSVIFVGNEKYYSASLTETTYPELGVYKGEGSSIVKSLNISVGQFTTHGQAISSGENAGIKVQRKKSLNLTNPNTGLSLTGGKVITLSSSYSNYRYVNGDLWCEFSSDELHF